MEQPDFSELERAMEKHVSYKPMEEEIATAKAVSLADKTRLSYWFPKLKADGLPVPKTILVQATGFELTNAHQCLLEDAAPKEVLTLVDKIKVAADLLGYPCFLRTDYTSGKHNWEKTCFLTKPDDILAHIIYIIEYSESVCITGLPCDRWAVRELLPTKSLGICRAYGNMPITREFRLFVDGCKVKCGHVYWVDEALEQGEALWNTEYTDEKSKKAALGFRYTTEGSKYKCENEEYIYLAACAGCAVGGGEWSVDILETEKGLYIIDMAEAHKSYHWEGCPNCPDSNTGG